jgi:hypothetical protein
MALLFFNQEDLLYRDMKDIESKLSDSEEFDKVKKKDRFRVQSHIDKIKEKRKEIIAKEEKEAQIRAKHEKIVLRRKMKLSEHEQELRIMEEQLKKEEEELKKKAEENEEDRDLSVRTTVRKYKSMAELKNVKPRIENLSVVAPRSKAYFEAHSRVRKLKNMMELSEQTKNILKTKQLKEMEMIISTEIHIKVTVSILR